MNLGSNSASVRIVALSFALAACKGSGSSGPNVATIAVANDEVRLHETFDGLSDHWEPVEGAWHIRPGEDGHVLAQTAMNRAFPVTLWTGDRFGDVDVSVRFKPISGQIDASGGIVFRAVDGANYYVIRANSLEDNFRLYTVVNGRRRRIAGATVEPPQLGVWHTLRVVAVGSHIEAFLDGQRLIEHDDTTFSNGRVGLWTKADAVTEFDDVVVRGVPAATAQEPFSTPRAR